MNKFIRFCTPWQQQKILILLANILNLKINFCAELECTRSDLLLNLSQINYIETRIENLKHSLN